MRTKYLFTIVMCCGLVAACEPERAQGPVVLTGLVDATEIDIAPKIPGRVEELLVQEGDRVEKGQRLVTISSDEISAKIDQVTAAIDASKAKLALARKGARDEEKKAVRKQVAAARHQAGITRKMYDRMSKLLKSGAVPQSKFDEVEFKYKVAQDQLAVAEAKYDIVMSGAREEELAALEALVKQAEGTLAEVQSYEKETAQSAPIASEVSKIVLHPGELAATGYPILTLVDLSAPWVTFSVREDLLSKVSQGSEFEVEIPALARRTKVRVFNIAAMGDFATWKATSEKNSFDLKTFEVKARPVTPVEGLRPGMTVRWTVEG